jgi:magnesium-transporting ATPase (P-type)
MSPLTQDHSKAEQGSRSSSRALVWIGVVLAIAGLAGILVALFRRRGPARKARPQPKPRPPQPQAVLDLQGLTEEEAAARKTGFARQTGFARRAGDSLGAGGTIPFKPLYSTREIWRANTLTIFNLSMVGLAVVQILLGKPFDAILTTAVLLLGIGLNAGQQLWARGRLRNQERAARPQATVIREGTPRSIDPAEVVRDDVLVVGPGDHILADGRMLGKGRIVVDESMLTGDPRQHTRQAGDPVYAGSFCVEGHAAYEAQKVGSDRLIAALTGEFEALEEELTPLERTIDRLLRVLLVVVAVLSLLLLADYFDLLFPNLHMDAFASAASVIFGIAPSSLFLMILVNYAMGTADLLRVGALVHRSRSVESLAQATVICFAQAGILTGVGLEVEPVAPPEDQVNGQPRLAESRIRQILGDFARSTSADSRAVKAMLGAFPGTRRRTFAEAPFLSVYGWSAVAFDDDDLSGVYILGEPRVLEAHLASEDGGYAAEGKDGASSASWRDRLLNLTRSLRRSEVATQAEEDSVPKVPEALGPQPLGATTTSGEEVSAEEASGPGPFQRLMKGVTDLLGRGEAEPEETGADRKGITEIVYLVAYRPELVPLHTAGGMPSLPGDLIPLCRLRYSEQVRPEAVETIQAFSQTGVEFKVFSSDAPERTATALAQAGLGGRDDTLLRATSGPELAALDREELAQAVAGNTIFGQMTPQQAGQVIEALRQQGETVAVVGDGVNDLQAMQQAHLSITRQSSSPAALSVADIVLLEDSPRAMLRVLEKGQRIANGLLDILKLYLTQITYLILLILAIWGMGIGFPYQSKQGSLITIVSVVLPSVGLSLWAASGVVPRNRLGWLLARSVSPAAVLMGIAGVVVYRIFLARSGDVAYAQLALTYLLVISGLMLVVLLRPPVRLPMPISPTSVAPTPVGRTPVGRTPVGPGQGGDQRSGDWRPAALCLVLLILVFVAASIPLADQLFALTQLRQPIDYLMVGVAVLAWAFTTVLVWRIAPLQRLWSLLRS